MSAFLTLSDLSLSAPDGRLLFTDLSLALGREPVGLVGPNGCGKSTLMAAIAGEIAPAGGTISANGTVGRLHQSWPDPALPLARALGIAEGLARLSRIESGTQSPEALARDLDAADWSLPDRAAAALDRVGLRGVGFDRPLGTLSGGQRTRVGLARLLLKAPDLALLDEPTNNLDTAARGLLGDIIADWPRGMLVASHDRELLSEMTRIVEIAPRRNHPAQVHLHGGGWEVYAQARAARRARAETALARAENAVAETRAAVAREAEKQSRRDAAGRRSRAGGSQPKMLLDARAARAERTGARLGVKSARLTGAAEEARTRAAQETEATRALSLGGQAAEAHGIVLRLDEACLVRGALHLGPLDLALGAGERIAITGPNGAGKSTLAALLAGHLAPDRGTRTAKDGVALLDQSQDRFDPGLTLLDNLRALDPALRPHDAHALLARFGFRGDAGQRPFGQLSGGEKLRLGLAAAFGVSTPPATLILDEPTNHLDLDAIEELERALTGWTGALVVISHDPGFVDATGPTRRLNLAMGRLTRP